MAKIRDFDGVRTFWGPYDCRYRGAINGMEFALPTRTKQAAKDECDINRIMARYLKTGQVPGGVLGGSYGDVSSGVDYLEAQGIILNAQKQFAALPAKVRDRFANNPFEMLEFIGDEKNIPEARELGLLAPEPKAPDASKPDATK